MQKNVQALLNQDVQAGNSHPVPLMIVAVLANTARIAPHAAHHLNMKMIMIVAAAEMYGS